MIYIMDCCHHLIRTLPMIPTDSVNLDDIDTDSEDHAADTLRYGCMSRPWLPPEVKNRLEEAKQYGRPMNSFTMDEAWSCRSMLGSRMIPRG